MTAFRTSVALAGFLALAQLAWRGQLWATVWRGLRSVAGVVIHRWRPAAPTAPAPPLHFAVPICLGVLATLWNLRFDSWVHPW